MPQAVSKIAFQALWQVQLGPPRMAAPAPDGSAVAVLGRDGSLALLDARGSEKWRQQIGANTRAVSITTRGECLVTDDQGFAALINPDGRLAFKKRVVPALFGLIAASGSAIALVTRDPTVVLTDRIGRIQWTYRNLLKPPAAIAIAEAGQTVVFACRNELGEGVVAIGPGGKPFNPFMGLDPVTDLAVSNDGEVVVALDREQCVFCLNIVKSFGIWKGRLNAPFNALSYADQTRQTLVTAKNGQMALLDEQGQPVWEHHFPHSLLRADLSRDGQTIVYVTTEGQVGVLRSRQGRDLSRLEFVEVPVDTAAQPAPQRLHRAWRIDLEPRPAGLAPCWQQWRGTDQIEYLLVTVGEDGIRLVSDLGDEVWTQRWPGSRVTDLDVDPDQDLIVAVTSRGVVMLGLDGAESGRLLAEVRQVHLLADGGMLLLDAEGQLQFNRQRATFGHAVPLDTPGRRLFGSRQHAWVIGDEAIVVVDAAGGVRKTVPIAAPVTAASQTLDRSHLLVGLANGELLALADDGNIAYRNRIDGVARALHWDRKADVVSAAAAGRQDLLSFENRAGQRRRLPVSGEAVAVVGHHLGQAVVTTVDEVYLIDGSAVTRWRYSSPDRVLDLIPSYSATGIYLLSTDSLTRLDAADPTAGSRLGYVEL